MDNYSVTKKSAREILLVGALNVVKRHHINQALPTLQNSEFVGSRTTHPQNLIPKTSQPKNSTPT